MICFLLRIMFVAFGVFSQTTREPPITFSYDVTTALLEAMANCSKTKTDEPKLRQIMLDRNYNFTCTDGFSHYICCVFITAGYAYDNCHFKVKESAAAYPDTEAMTKLFEDCNNEVPPGRNTTGCSIMKCFEKNTKHPEIYPPNPYYSTTTAPN